MQTKLGLFLANPIGVDRQFEQRVNGKSPELVFQEIAEAIRIAGFTVCTLRWIFLRKCRVMLVGGEDWSRALAVQEEDPVGAIMLLKDDGKEFDQRHHVQPERAYWLRSGLLEGYRDNIADRLGSKFYKNDRLKTP